jgi:hypothetical protein
MSQAHMYMFQIVRIALFYSARLPPRSPARVRFLAGHVSLGTYDFRMKMTLGKSLHKWWDRRNSTTRCVVG